MLQHLYLSPHGTHRTDVTHAFACRLSRKGNVRPLHQSRKCGENSPRSLIYLFCFGLFCCCPQNATRAVYRTLPANVAGELAYVPDQMILDFVLVKVKQKHHGVQSSKSQMLELKTTADSAQR